MKRRPIRLLVNGEERAVRTSPSETLSYVLRERLGLMGTKIACDEGTCGSCTVMVDEEPVYSCLTLAFACEGARIVTIEGLAQGDELDAVQKAFVETASHQCGFCTPGFIMSATALLDRVPNPSRDEVRKALSGNICRCTDYTRYVNAVLLAAELRQERRS